MNLLRVALLLTCCALGACSSSGRSTNSAQLAATAAERAAVVHSVEPWSFNRAKGRIIRTAHYRIFTTENDPAIVDRLPAFLEDALTNYRTSITKLPLPPTRLDTYLMDTRTQWKRITLQLLGTRGEPFLKIGRGGFATRGFAVLYDIGVFDTLAISAHEGWHQYTQRTFREPLPIWLEEGIATFMEGHKWVGIEPSFRSWANVERFDQLKKSHANASLISLQALLSSDPKENLGRIDDSALTYYAQVWALIHFLEEGAGAKYNAPFKTLLEDAAAGKMHRVMAAGIGGRQARAGLLSRRGPTVFLAYFNDDIAQASREYAMFLEQIVRPGARNAIVAGRSPIRSATQ